MPERAVLFDVDGTLVDSNYHHTLAWWRAFSEAGEDVPMWRLHRLVGMGADQLISEVVGGERPELEAGWTRHFAELRDGIRATAGAADLVRAAKERGAVVVLATSGQEQDVEHLRGVIGADEWVDDVVNSSEVEASKPASDIFALALERAGVPAERAVVVGDTVWDVLAAQRCGGLPCATVLTGGISAPELTSAGAASVSEDPAALLAAFDDSPLGALLGPSGAG